MRIVRAAFGIYRAAAFAVCGLLLSACGIDPYVENPGRDMKFGDTVFQTRDGPGWRRSSVGEWRIEIQTDRITGKTSTVAYLETRRSSGDRLFYALPASLALMCMDNYPIVRFGFHFKIGTTRQSQLGYRFDQRPGHETDARITPDHTVAVLEDPNEVSTFVNELATSKSLYVRIHALNAGRTSAEFQLDGANEAIAATVAKCPPQRVFEQPPKRTSALR